MDCVILFREMIFIFSCFFCHDQGQKKDTFVCHPLDDYLSYLDTRKKNHHWKILFNQILQAFIYSMTKLESRVPFQRYLSLRLFLTAWWLFPVHVSCGCFGVEPTVCFQNGACQKKKKMVSTKDRHRLLKNIAAKKHINPTVPCCSCHWLMLTPQHIF